MRLNNVIGLKNNRKSLRSLSPFEERCPAPLSKDILCQRAGQRGCVMDKRIVSEPYLTNSRNQRKSQNPWESKLWHFLRAGRFYGLKFKRQTQIGSYIFDFSCRSKMILIELDGGQHSEDIISEKDRIKQKYAENEGYMVLRFWNNNIDDNMEGVLETIKKACGG